MHRIARLVPTATLAAVLAGIAVPAAAQVAPRMARREARQCLRVERGLRCDQLGPREARRLYRNQRHIRRMELRARADALQYAAGYTIFNDVSARDYQRRTSQWMIGKSFDTFGPMGPALVTADEIPDPDNLDLWLTLNGQELQRTNTRHMIFSIAYIIACLSDVMTLDPGDVISTGTPAKTALAKTIPPFMKAGDRVSIQVEKIGELANPVVAEG